MANPMALKREEDDACFLSCLPEGKKYPLWVILSVSQDPTAKKEISGLELGHNSRLKFFYISHMQGIPNFFFFFY